jgi:hypothetical protein
MVYLWVNQTKRLQELGWDPWIGPGDARSCRVDGTDKANLRAPG